MDSAPTTHAGVVTRSLAAGVDVVAVALLTVALDLAAAGVRFVWSPVDFQWPQPAVLTAGVVLLAVAVLYLTIGWAMTGRTYGGRLLGLRVLSNRGALLGWTRSFLRAVTSVLWPVGLLWSGISRTRSSLQDLVFRTVVVYDPHPYVHAPPAESAQPGQSR
ncbi:MAG: RDD family protein [Blastococcus sp.]